MILYRDGSAARGILLIWSSKLFYLVNKNLITMTMMKQKGRQIRNQLTGGKLYNIIK